MSFKLPIESIIDATEVEDSLKDDLQLLDGDRPLYEMAFCPESELERSLFEKYSKRTTTDIDYLADMQKLIRGEAHVRDKIVDIEFISSGLKRWRSNDSFNIEYGYVDWSPLDFINKDDGLLQGLYLYSMFCPILALVVPIICLIIPLFWILAQSEQMTLQLYVAKLQVLFKNHSLADFFRFRTLTQERKLFLTASLVLYGRINMNNHK